MADQGPAQPRRHRRHRRSRRGWLPVALVLFVLLLGVEGRADDGASEGPTPSPAADPEGNPDKYSASELEEIVGPIALYPDIVLASLLPASNYPLDIVQASRFLKKNDGKVDEVPEDKGWDKSVEAMLQYPDVMTWMSENLDWLQQLGYAVAVQQEDVLNSIQAFRRTTAEAGNLKSNDYQNVVVQDTDSDETETIPADAEGVAVE